MRDPERIERILQLLRQVWYKYPDLRLCQLVQNAGYAVCFRNDIFYVEDDDIEIQLKKALSE